MRAKHPCTLTGLLILGGCAPVSHAPAVPTPTPPLPRSEVIAPESGPPQQLQAGGLVGSRWWRVFASAKLDALVDALLVHDTDVTTAEATLRQAQEQAEAAAGGLGPQLDANYQLQRARIAGVLATPLADASNYLYTLHTAQVTVAYPIDVFGGIRNRIVSARAAAEVASDRLDAARATAVANLVLAVIQHASLEAQIEATRSAIARNRDLVALLERRRALGDAGEADVVAQRTALATAEAALPPLERQMEHQAALIDTMTGRAAGSPAPDIPSIAELMLPQKLPVSVPAQIVANRPDVRAAAAQMKGAAADLGAAAAARFPSFQITGNAGGSALTLANLFAPANIFYTLAGGVTQPIVHSGQLKQQMRAAEAALQSTQSQYRAAVLQAFMDVDDALTGLRTDAAALDAAARADDAAQRSFGFIRRQVELGASGTFALLTASATASQARAQLVQARAARLSDSVALVQACGATITGESLP